MVRPDDNLTIDDTRVLVTTEGVLLNFFSKRLVIRPRKIKSRANRTGRGAPAHLFDFAKNHRPKLEGWAAP